MTTENSSDSTLRDETALRWGFLEEEDWPCAVVSDRMELVYINASGRALVPQEWFGRRCYEVLPNVDEACGLHCPTMAAVHEAAEPVYCKEELTSSSGETVTFGVAVIPLALGERERVKAVLLLHRRGENVDEAGFQQALLGEAALVRELVVQHIGRG